MIEWFIIVTLVCAIIFCAYKIGKMVPQEKYTVLMSNRDAIKHELIGALNKNHELEKDNDILNHDLKRIIKQKKSQEVKTGHIVEELAPILDNFPADKKDDIIPLFRPIDYLVIDYDADKIKFVEVKSGDSQLSQKQKKIVEMIKNKSITFEIFRIK